MRRALLVALTLAVLASGCSRSKAPPIAGDHKLAKLTERVYVLHGPNELPNKANQGFMNNPGFVLTKKGVVVIDPGSSVQVGELVLKKIVEVTKDPVIAVFTTHIHGDHWLGNQAIKAVFPRAVIYAHANMKTKTGVEGENWVRLLNNMTDGAITGTQPVAPDINIDNDETLKLGDTHFRIYHTGKAHTDGDIMIEVIDEKVMFLGDNVNNGFIVRMDDGNFKGNIAAAEAALKTKATLFVPGHGKSDGRKVVNNYLTYLKALHAAVKKYYAQGLSDFDMKDKVIADLKPYHKWARFDDEIGKLIGLAYLQVEADAF